MADSVAPAETAAAPHDQRWPDDDAGIPLARDARSAEQLGAVLEHSFDTTTVLEADGTIRYTTPSAHRISGGPVAVTIGRNGFDRVHPDDADVREVLDTAGLDHQTLCVEIMESVLMEDADVGAPKALKALGVRVSVDDFGTGYSSLGTCVGSPWTRSRSTVPSSRGWARTPRTPPSSPRS